MKSPAVFVNCMAIFVKYALNCEVEKKREIVDIKIFAYLKIQSKERDLEEKVIREILTDPDQIVEGNNDRKVAQKKFSENGKEYLIRVVFEEKNKRRIGITAHKTSKVDKYWRKEK